VQVGSIYLARLGDSLGQPLGIPLPCYREILDDYAALPRNFGWYNRAPAGLVCPGADCNLNCQAHIAAWRFRFWPGGLYRGPSTALPRILLTGVRATNACGIARTALPQACGSGTAADLFYIY